MNKKDFNLELKKRWGYAYNPDKPISVGDINIWLEHQPDRTVEITMFDTSRRWWIGDPKYMSREVAIDYLTDLIKRIGGDNPLPAF